eukprot:227570-Karenia_brevis.AAC.1
MAGSETDAGEVMKRIATEIEKDNVKYTDKKKIYELRDQYLEELGAASLEGAPEVAEAKSDPGVDANEEKGGPESDSSSSDSSNSDDEEEGSD